MLVHRRVAPNIKFAGTHLYIWVERGTVRVKCLAQEHNIMSPARVQALAGDIVLCSWTRHFTLRVPLSTQVDTSELNVGGNPAMD